MPSTSPLPNLPPAIAREILATLTATLPLPPDDTPDARAARDQTAIAAVAALHPADAMEALLAAQIVTADAHAKDSLREAVAPGQDPATARRCRAQACAMMRQMQSGLRTLQRTQAAREKAEAATDPTAMERAGWWFRDVSVPDPAAVQAEPLYHATPPQPAIPAQLNPSFQLSPPPQPSPPFQPSPALQSASSLQPDDIAEAEHYAAIQPGRAARIRAYGGMPFGTDFAPPDQPIIEALVKGATPRLRARDHLGRA